MKQEVNFESEMNDPIIVIDKTHIPQYLRHNFSLWIHNTSDNTLYFKIVEELPNWVFSTTSDIPADGKLGAIAAGASKHFLGLIERNLPAGESEDDGMFKVECYPDNTYTGLIESHSHPTTIYIEDLENWANVQKSDFDDGTAQGWTLNGMTIENDKSVDIPGYSARGMGRGSRSIEKTIVLPNTPKVRASFYWFYKATSPVCTLNIATMRMLVDGSIVYECLRAGQPIFGASVEVGWFKSGVDISDYKGQTVSLKIEAWMENCNHLMQSNWWWVDDVVVAGK